MLCVVCGLFEAEYARPCYSMLTHRNGFWQVQAQVKAALRGFDSKHLPFGWGHIQLHACMYGIYTPEDCPGLKLVVSV